MLRADTAPRFLDFGVNFDTVGEAYWRDTRAAFEHYRVVVDLQAGTVRGGDKARIIGRQGSCMLPSARVGVSACVAA